MLVIEDGKFRLLKNYMEKMGLEEDYYLLLEAMKNSFETKEYWKNYDNSYR